MENKKFHTYKIGMGTWIQRMYLACKNKQIKITLFMYWKKKSDNNPVRKQYSSLTHFDQITFYRLINSL